MMKRICLALALGVILGFGGSYMLFLQIWTLVPWGIAAIALGYWAPRGGGFLIGGVYGFTLSFVFMIAGYNGAEALMSRLPFFALLGLFGALCGMLLTLAGSLLKKRKNR